MCMIHDNSPLFGQSSSQRAAVAAMKCALWLARACTLPRVLFAPRRLARAPRRSHTQCAQYSIWYVLRTTTLSFEGPQLAKPAEGEQFLRGKATSFCKSLGSVFGKMYACFACRRKNCSLLAVFASCDRSKLKVVVRRTCQMEYCAHCVWLRRGACARRGW